MNALKVLISSWNGQFLIDVREADHSEIDLENQRLREALERYKESNKGTKFHMDLNLEKNHTWQDVLESVNDAARQYENPEGHWGKIRKALRKFGTNHKAFDAWAKTLPNQSQYFSVLCGGLQLIIGVCSATYNECAVSLRTLTGCRSPSRCEDGSHRCTHRHSHFIIKNSCRDGHIRAF